MTWLAEILAGAREDLATSPAAVEYLASRGVSLELAQRYGVGYANPMRQAVGTDAWVKWAQRYWSHRLVFPLYNTLGQPVGMQTRSLVEKEYQLYYAAPSELHPYVFGLDVALPAMWERGHVVVVEGVFDALALAPYTDCVIAILRAKPSRTVQALLRRYVRSVTAFLDMDEPGREGCMSLMRWAEDYLVSMPSYPAHDPAEWVASGAGARVAALLAHAKVPLIP